MLRQIDLSLLWLVSLSAVLLIGSTGCGELGDAEWVGTWTLQTVDGQSIQQQVEAIELLIAAFGEDKIDISYTDGWTFDGDGTWHRDVTWRESTAKTQETIPFGFMGTYSLSGANYTLTLTEGVFTTLTTDTDDVKGGIIELETESDFAGIDTGTWAQNGETLTLTSDGGHVLVFKKK